MPDAAAIADRRTVLPFEDSFGNTVALDGGQIRISLTVDLLPVLAALDLSAAIGLAVAYVGELRSGGNPDHTTRTEANHG